MVPLPAAIQSTAATSKQMGVSRSNASRSSGSRYTRPHNVRLRRGGMNARWPLPKTGRAPAGAKRYPCAETIRRVSSTRLPVKPRWAARARQCARLAKLGLNPKIPSPRCSDLLAPSFQNDMRHAAPISIPRTKSSMAPHGGSQGAAEPSGPKQHAAPRSPTERPGIPTEPYKTTWS